MIITVTPNPAVDRTLQIGRLQEGAVHRAEAVRVEPSGKGVNVSRALTVNGLRAPAVLPVGGAEGAQLVALLDAEGVPHRAVPVGGSTRVNVSVCADGRVTKLNEPGPVLRPEDGPALLDAVTGLVDEAGTPGTPLWIVGSGSLPAGLDDGFYAELGARADRLGARFALDSSGPALREGLRARPSVVKPNLSELEELCGRRLPTLGVVVDAAREVGRATGGSVLVSLGRRGALLVDDDGVLLGRDDVPNPYPVGGGDNLLAGFLAGLSRGLSRARALREAVAWATVAVRTFGSVGRAVTEEDRASVRLASDPPDDLPST